MNKVINSIISKKMLLFLLYIIGKSICNITIQNMVFPARAFYKQINNLTMIILQKLIRKLKDSFNELRSRISSESLK